MKLLFIVFSVFVGANFVNAQDYKPGEVIVGFHDNVTEDQACALIKSYGLSFEGEFEKTFSFWVKVLKGSPKDYIDDLESSDIVSWAKWSGNPHGEPGAKYIEVQFNTRATYQTARKLIDSFKDLEVSSAIYPPNWLVIKVTEGEEEKWIKTFEKEKIVKYAQLNFRYVAYSVPEKDKGKEADKIGGKSNVQKYQQQLKELDEQMANEQTRFPGRKAKLEQKKATAQQQGDTKTVARIDGLIAEEQQQYDKKKQQMEEKRKNLLELIQQDSKDANQPAKKKSKS